MGSGLCDHDDGSAKLAYVSLTELDSRSERHPNETPHAAGENRAGSNDGYLCLHC